jgi:hypothetical protein
VTIAAYPLQWPEGWKRTEPHRRKFGHFGKKVSTSGSSWKRTEDLSVADAVNRVLTELQRMAVGRDDIVISTNLRTRLDGLPRSDQRRPDDPGAAVYWQESTGERRCIAIDQYTTVEDNLAAVAATLDAMRAIKRHGGAAILERAFTGFTALPAPGAAREWWEVLGLPSTASIDEARAAYRRLASAHHPDRGGDARKMAEVNEAWALAQQRLQP